MAEQLSISASGLAFAGIVDSETTPEGAHHHHIALGLSHAGYPVRRDMEAHAASEGNRERTILERLFDAAGISPPRVRAAELIERYGTLDGVLQAAAQQKIEGGAGRLFNLISETHQAMLRSRLTAKPVLANSQAVIDYLKATMAHLPYEQVRVLYLGHTNRLIADRAVSTGTIDEAPIYPREIIRHALDLAATGIVVAHNHPSGDAQPSAQDVKATRKLIAACREIHIEVHDHIIVTAGCWASMRALQLI